MGDIILDTLLPTPPIIESMEGLGRYTEELITFHIERNGMLDGGPRVVGIFTLEPNLTTDEEQRVVDAVEKWSEWQSFRYAFGDFAVVVKNSQGIALYRGSERGERIEPKRFRNPVRNRRVAAADGAPARNAPRSAQSCLGHSVPGPACGRQLSKCSPGDTPPSGGSLRNRLRGLIQTTQEIAPRSVKEDCACASSPVRSDFAASSLVPSQMAQRGRFATRSLSDMFTSQVSSTLRLSAEH